MKNFKNNGLIFIVISFFWGCPVEDKDTEFWIFLSTNSKNIHCSLLSPSVNVDDEQVVLNKRNEIETIHIYPDGDTLYTQDYFNEDLKEFSGVYVNISILWKKSTTDSVILPIDTIMIISEKKKGIFAHIGKKYPYTYERVYKKVSMESFGGSQDDTLFVESTGL